MHDYKIVGTITSQKLPRKEGNVYIENYSMFIKYMKNVHLVLKSGFTMEIIIQYLRL